MAAQVAERKGWQRMGQWRRKEKKKKIKKYTDR